MKSGLLALIIVLFGAMTAQAVLVPNCFEEMTVDCMEALDLLGLVGVIHLEYSVTEKGLVTRTDPSFGSDVELGSTVGVYESRGALTPEAYNYQGFIYVLLGVLGSLSLVAGLAIGMKAGGGLFR